jgi:hypothetical protein
VEQATSQYSYAANLEPNNAVYHANLAHELNLQHLNKQADVERETVARLN